MKKIIMILLSVLLACTLFGCQDPTPKPDPTPDPPKPTAPLTEDELLALLANYPGYYGVDNHLYISYNSEDKIYTEAFQESEYQASAKIISVEWIENNDWKITAKFIEDGEPKGSEVEYIVTFDKATPDRVSYVVNGSSFSFAADIGLNKTGLLEILSNVGRYLYYENDKFCGLAEFTSSSKLLTFEVKDNEIIQCDPVTIKEIEYIGMNQYTMVLAGDDGAEVNMFMSYYNEENIVLYNEDYTLLFVLDVGLTKDELLNRLNQNGPYYIYKGYMASFKVEKKDVAIWIESSTWGYDGNVTEFEYLGGYLYRLKVNGQKTFDCYITINNDNKQIKISVPTFSKYGTHTFKPQ